MAVIGSILGNVAGSWLGDKILGAFGGGSTETEQSFTERYPEAKQVGKVASASNTETQTSSINDWTEDFIQGVSGFFSGQSAPSAQSALQADVGTVGGGLANGQVDTVTTAGMGNILSLVGQGARALAPYGVGAGAGLAVDQAMNYVTSPSPGRMTAIGVLRLSPKGNLIITRRMKTKMKSLADSVGLEGAANIVGIDVRTASAILLKSFPSRERGVTGREIRQCRRVVNKMKHFYSMIPTRTSSSTRRTYGSKVTQIKN